MIVYWCKKKLNFFWLNKKFKNFFHLESFAWTHFIFSGAPLFEMYLCINFIARSSGVFVTTLAVGTFDYSSIVTRKYATLISSSGRGAVKCNCTSSFGSNTDAIWNDFSFPKAVFFNFYFVLCLVLIPGPFGQWSGDCLGTKYSRIGPTLQMHTVVWVEECLGSFV